MLLGWPFSLQGFISASIARASSGRLLESAKYNPHSMRDVVIGQRDLPGSRRKRDAVQLDAGHAATNAARIFDRDFISSQAVSIDYLEPWPSARDAWIDQERFAANTKAQYPLETRPIHPSRRARIPCPSATPDVRRGRVQVGACDVRLDFVAIDSCARVRVVDRVQHREQFDCFVSIAEHRKRDHGPQSAVRVLASVLPDTGRIALDISGVEGSLIERRSEQQHEAVFAANQVFVDRRHRGGSVSRICRACDYAPRLRDR